MNRGPSRVGFRECGAIERGFQVRRKRAGLFRGGPNTRRARGHVARLHFAQNFLPRAGVRRYVAQAEALERQTGGLELVVVTSQARPFHERRVLGRKRRQTPEVYLRF